MIQTERAPHDAAISFTVPFPPSTNSLFRGRRFKTSAYKAWRNEAGLTILVQNVPRLPPGDVKVEIALPHGFRVGDIDNRIKGLLDAIVDMQILTDDRFVCDLRIYWNRGSKSCWVAIWPAVERAALADWGRI